MPAPELTRVIVALERWGLDLGDTSQIEDAAALAQTVEVAAKNYAIGRRKLRREMAELRDNQRANTSGTFEVDNDHPQYDD